MSRVVWIDDEKNGVCPFCHKAESYTPKLRVRLPKNGLALTVFMLPWILGLMWLSWAVVDLIQSYVPSFGLGVGVAVIFWIAVSSIIVLRQRE